MCGNRQLSCASRSLCSTGSTSWTPSDHTSLPGGPGGVCQERRAWRQRENGIIHCAGASSTKRPHDSPHHRVAEGRWWWTSRTSIIQKHNQATSAHLDTEGRGALQRITPNLWFDDQAEEAAEFYTGVFKDSRISAVARYGSA